MSDKNREIQELLADYAEALRDGSIPTFLKSLTRSEGKRIASAPEFWDAAEVVRYLNSAGFADKTATPDVGLFISRVDAKIASRMKKARGVTRPASERTAQRPATKTQRTENTI
ncbi:MAG: hypothetical protein JW720_13295 [Sedimentisphaerales bacterium]|nr:hypothetical protein [Sedimentisphaerales bacterium]